MKLAHNDCTCKKLVTFKRGASMYVKTNVVSFVMSRNVEAGHSAAKLTLMKKYRNSAFLNKAASHESGQIFIMFAKSKNVVIARTISKCNGTLTIGHQHANTKFWICWKIKHAVYSVQKP